MSALAKISTHDPQDFPLPSIHQLPSLKKQTIAWLTLQLVAQQGWRRPTNADLDTDALISIWYLAATCAGHTLTPTAFDRACIALRVRAGAHLDLLVDALALAGHRGVRPIHVTTTRLHLTAWAHEARSTLEIFN